MKIVKADIRREDFVLSRPYTIAFKTTTHVSNLIVELQDDKGRIGLGAASPEVFVTGETIDDSLLALNRDWPGFFSRYEPGSRGFWQALTKELPETPAARAAVDMAVYDLLAQQAGKPLAAFLGQKKTELPTSITIGIKPAAEVLSEADEYMSRGFRVIKLKLGAELEEDIERVFKLREWVGDDVAIRVDPNQGYSVFELEKFLARTSDASLEFIEQPVKVKDFSGLTRLSAEARENIAADESLLSPADAEKLVRPEKLCGIFNIKLMKCGGIHPALAIADVAAKNDVGLMWGCMDESRISIAAALHAAFACSNTNYLDLDGHLDLGRDVVEGGFVIENGIMKLGEAPGLGVKSVSI